MSRPHSQGGRFTICSWLVWQGAGFGRHRTGLEFGLISSL
jgi:hypothetical protein